ncbi:unannotated protein [freshwater metagenome]|uniref:Unannotated protein n=1 Tax=freshwater metagenome TaxID=449393 RepID=A0A6J7EU01_9ZZZZ|nr:LysM peptidoglycan-binding domain-containing protein [Actinomycetota bacterium]
MSAITVINQGFSINPSVRLNRRGRLARTLVVLSLAIVAASVAGGGAGADTDFAPIHSKSFITVTVAPGDTVWSLANRVSEGHEVRSLVAQIIEVNSLTSGDVTAGQKIRIPLS